MNWEIGYWVMELEVSLAPCSEASRRLAPNVYAPKTLFAGFGGGQTKSQNIVKNLYRFHFGDAPDISAFYTPRSRRLARL